jgi:hypothetical protein
MKFIIYMIALALVSTAHMLMAADDKTGADGASIEKPASGTVIGTVKTVTGDITIIRNHKRFTAKAGTTLCVNDALKTGRDGALGVIFKDNGALSMGPNSQVVISAFVFIPEQKNFSMITDVLKGTCVYWGGLIAKLKPRSVRFNTPSATIGIRGTRFAVKVGGL